MDLVKAAEQIKKEDGVYMWLGPEEGAEDVRNALWNHWEKCAGQPMTNEPVFNMHSDIRCVDRRYITTDPANWEAPKKKETTDE
jgi:hypothetical protein